ncbi:enhancer of polycomb homolog 1 [Clonorchis sinensis]|uniref:Enhancer of polycomb-like protein n=1 Tax=Clonorchis sinensis TaxID=79923 RepID=G7YEV8_CLOSI|nr:enhancer of polycomb homolog 1 [Clonorchis sinensis]
MPYAMARVVKTMAKHSLRMDGKENFALPLDIRHVTRPSQSFTSVWFVHESTSCVLDVAVACSVGLYMGTVPRADSPRALTATLDEYSTKVIGVWAVCKSGACGQNSTARHSRHIWRNMPKPAWCSSEMRRISYGKWLRLPIPCCRKGCEMFRVRRDKHVSRSSFEAAQIAGSVIHQTKSMSKVSFRARQIDFNKPLPIVKDGSDILAEFSENAFVNRGVPQIPSGMEKEEENEHHFVEVIQALQLNSGADVKIPVPDIIDRSTWYKKIYSDEFALPTQLVHIRNIVLAEDEPTDYDMDTEDEEWLSRSQLDVTPQKFESMIDRLERGCGQKVMNLEEANYLLQDDPSLVIAVYDYWLNKRVQSRQPLLFSVRQERRDSGSNADPYVAFRRRSEKMQTRKNRKNDEQSYEKMLILRDQMDTLGFVCCLCNSHLFREILSMLVKRETTKEAIVQSSLRMFEARCRLQDWDGVHLLEAENVARKLQRPADGIGIIRPPKESVRKRSTRKRKLTHRILNLSLRAEDASDTELNEPNADGPFAFVRMQGCRYLRPRYFIYLRVLPCDPLLIVIRFLSPYLFNLNQRANSGANTSSHQLDNRNELRRLHAPTLWYALMNACEDVLRAEFVALNNRAASDIQLNIFRLPRELISYCSRTQEILRSIGVDIATSTWRTVCWSLKAELLTEEPKSLVARSLYKSAAATMDPTPIRREFKYFTLLGSLLNTDRTLSRTGCTFNHGACREFINHCLKVLYTPLRLSDGFVWFPWQTCVQINEYGDFCEIEISLKVTVTAIIDILRVSGFVVSRRFYKDSESTSHRSHRRTENPKIPLAASTVTEFPFWMMFYPRRNKSLSLYRFVFYGFMTARRLELCNVDTCRKKASSLSDPENSHAKSSPCLTGSTYIQGVKPPALLGVVMAVGELRTRIRFQNMDLSLANDGCPSKENTRIAITTTLTDCFVWNH